MSNNGNSVECEHGLIEDFCNKCFAPVIDSFKNVLTKRAIQALDLLSPETMTPEELDEKFTPEEEPHIHSREFLRKT